MTIKYKDTPICNDCDQPIVDLSKALLVVGTIVSGDMRTLSDTLRSEEPYLGDNKKMYHSHCLARILGLNVDPGSSLTTTLDLQALHRCFR